MLDAGRSDVLHYLKALARPASPTEEADAELLARFVARRDEAAFAGLVRRHGPLVWNLCRRALPQVQDAEDAFQATFLVLAHKAGSISKRESLGSWLYGVALRVAARARDQAARRAARQVPLQDMAAPATDPLTVDLRPILDEEINRLPERYRLPILLCYLEGKTNDEAAALLGHSRGTIASRLARGRERLRGRLLRRGVTLTGATLAALAAEATPPAQGALVESTVRAACLSASDAEPALALCKGVLQAMLLARIKIAIGFVVALALVATGAGMIASGALTDEPGRAGGGSAPATAASAQPPARAETPPKGAPKAGKPQDPDQDPASAVALESPQDVASRLQNTRINFEGFDDTNISLQEALEFLHRRYNLNFTVNEAAFREAGMNNPLETQSVTAGRPLPKMSMVTPDVVLRSILTRVIEAPSDPQATYLIREHSIEITTTTAVRKELGLSENESLPPLVYVSFTKRPFQAVVNELRGLTHYSIILDPRCAEQAKMEINAEFKNVPIETTLLVLTDMVGLKITLLNNVIYVTTPENAERLRKERPKQ